MRNIVFIVVLLFVSLTFVNAQSQKEIEAKKHFDKIQEWDKRDSLSAVEKKMEWQMVQGIREYDKDINLGKTREEAYAGFERKGVFTLVNQNQVFVKVRIKREKENEKTKVRSFIETHGGKIEQKDRDVLFLYYCFLPVEAIKQVAELDAVAFISRVYGGVTQGKVILKGDKK